MNDEDYLYVIIPYFNFIDFKISEENLSHFINKNNFTNKVRLVISEGIYNKKLNIKSNLIFKHLTFNIKDPIWLKENLINSAIKHLPNDWKYLLWCDKDILFTNSDWIENSIEKLKNSDVIQPWSKVFFLEKGETDTTKCSRQSINYKESICSVKKQGINKDGHTGMAWGINRNFYNKINKILDWYIIGSGDVAFAYCCGLHNERYSLFQTKDMEIMLSNYIKNFNNIKIDYLEQSICHIYHGKRSNRQYSRRMRYLLKNKYNPSKDIFYDENNILNLTKDGERLRNYLEKYFFSRDEDDTLPWDFIHREEFNW